MTYTLVMSPADEALMEEYAARENLSVPDFMLRTTKEAIKRRTHAPRPKARDEMTDEELVEMIDQSLEEAHQGMVTPAKEVFEELRRELGAYGV